MTVAASAGAGCGGSPDDRRPGAGTATTGAGGATATAGAQAGQSGAVDPAAVPGSTLFVRQYGDDGQQTLTDVAADDAGNVYVAGSETVPGALESVFVLQYDSAGVLRWRLPLVPTGTSDSARVAGVAFQPTTGAVILAGFLSGTMTVGEKGIEVSSGIGSVADLPVPNLWLTALDKSGYVVWSKVFTSSNAVFPDQVFVTASGDIEVIGTARDNATVGGGPLCCEGPDRGITTFVARYSPTGEHLWSQAFGGRFFSGGADTDAAGGLVVAGSISGTATFDGQTFVAGGQTPGGKFINDGIVFRLTPEGHISWGEFITSDAHIFPAARLDRAGNVLLFGTFQGDALFGNGQQLTFTPPADATQAAFLAKLGPDGFAQWARSLPPVGTAFVDTGDLAVDGAGNMLLTGIADEGAVSLAGVPGQADVGSGDFIAKYAPDGTYLWSRGLAVQWGVMTIPYVAVAFDSAGNLAAAGNFDNTVDFGTATLTAPGVLTLAGRGAPAPHIPDDVFVLKLAP